MGIVAAGRWSRVALGLVLGVVAGAAGLLAAEPPSIERVITTQCAGCHRLQGPPESRFNIAAPDLMWAGSKYQRAWLIGWLTGKEPAIYPKGYRWDKPEPEPKHVVLSEADAHAVADYFERHLVDPRVKVGALDLGTFNRMEAEFGRQIYMQHACVGCHQVEDGGRIVGGPQSASLVEAGRRYNVDWLYRFGMNPQDFVPHSGEFLADASGLGLRYIIGYVATRGVKDFKYAEPWTGPAFQHASASRGKLVYREYCMQCHGATGRGDGPAASGLDPKPAVHAQMAFDKFPTEYLYNVIYYGGRSVGKSPNMPYWGLTLGEQGVADVIAYLRDTFHGETVTAAAEPAGKPSGVCPQARTTRLAPADMLAKTNPLPNSSETIQAGRTLFQESARPLACMNCHGAAGDGRGVAGLALAPPPRNFTCAATMKKLPDGQLFWIIKNGSPGTGMMPFSNLSDDEVWQLIAYLRTLAK
jgi:mono/diheme cytochrome c family protein